MRRIGRVVDNKDPKEIGRLLIRIYPELESLEDDSLPWVLPRVETNSHSIPPIGSFVFVEVSKDWTVFFYERIGPPISSRYPYKSIKESLEEMEGLETQEYPQPIAIQREDGSIFFHNEDTGESGLKHSSGMQILLKKDGSFSLFQKGKIDLKFDSSGSKMTIEGIDNIEIGGGGDSLVLYETLSEILDKLLTHNHIAPTGPTLPAQESSGSPLSTLKGKLSQMKSKILTSD